MNIILFGYYGFGNFGDDQLLHTIIQKLNSYDRNLNVTVIGNGNIISNFIHFEKTRYVKRNAFNILKEVKNNDVFIVGGGGLFPQHNIFKLLLFLLVAKLAVLLKKKVAFIGIEITAPPRKFEKVIWKKIILLSELFTVRSDFMLKQYFTDIFIKKHINVLSDIVFSNNYKQNSRTQKKMVVVSLCNIFFNENEKFRDDFIIKICELFLYLLSNNFKIKMISFFDRSDDILYSEIIKILNDTNIQKINYNKNFNEIFKYFNEAEYSINMRYHSLVLSSMFCTPGITIAYSPKVEGLAHELGLQKYTSKICVDKNNYYYEMFNINSKELVSQFKNLEENYETVKNQMDDSLKILREKSLKNFDLLFYLMNV